MNCINLFIHYYAIITTQNTVGCWSSSSSRDWLCGQVTC